MEWACAAGAYAAWLAGEDPTEWRNARLSDEAVTVNKRASLERLVGGPLKEDVREFAGVNRCTSWLRNDLDVCTATDPTAATDKGFLVYDDAATAVDPGAPAEEGTVGGKLDQKPIQEFQEFNDLLDLEYPTVKDNEVVSPIEINETDSNLIPKFGEVWISKDRRRANYFTVRSVNLKDGEVHTSDHRTIKLSRMSRYRKLK